MDFILLNASTAGDELNETANVSAHIADIGGRKTVFQVAADELIFSQADDLQVFVAGAFEILLRAGRRIRKVVLQRLGDLQPDKQSFGPFLHQISPSLAQYHTVFE